MSMEHYHPAAIIDGPGACVTIYKRSYSPEKIDKHKFFDLEMISEYMQTREVYISDKHRENL